VSAAATTLAAVRRPFLFCLALLAVATLPASSLAAPKSGNAKALKHGSLVQLKGPRGCLVDKSTRVKGCGTGRALKGPGPFMGSRAIAVSPDGKNVYVASSRSDAIAVFRRDTGTGSLTQSKGSAGCIANESTGACAKAVGLDGPNSIAISPDGRSVYATSRNSNAVTVFQRSPKGGRLTQLPIGFGCISGLPVPVCASGRALVGPDVVVISPDGRNIYVGSFFGNAIAVFNRDPASGALAQAAGTTGCLAEAIGGCAPGFALGAPEGLAISAAGTSLYAATALSNAVVVLSRDPSTGALTQAGDGSGCIANAALAGCGTGVQLSGANAVAVSPGGGDVYVTSLFSNSVTSFTRAVPAGTLAQKQGTAACLIYLRSAGCSFGRALVAPEGIAVSPDGTNVYVAAFGTGAIAVLDRSRETGVVTQKPGAAGCLAAPKMPGCSPGRALRGVSSIALSPDGRYLYSTSFGSNAVNIFRRNQ
jgi:DNA-binding beta-propeller fold protein YncE